MVTERRNISRAVNLCPKCLPDCEKVSFSSLRSSTLMYPEMECNKKSVNDFK